MKDTKSIFKRLAKSFSKEKLVIVEEKMFPKDSINDSPNLVALYPTLFALYFWIAYLTSHPLEHL
jgi:hypothetical protein